MTKHLIVAMALLLSTASEAFAQTAPKFGHIDRQKLMLMLPQRKDAEAKMQAFAKTLEERLKAMGTEYQSKLAEAQARAEQMTNTEREIAMRELQDLEQRIVAAQEKAQEDLAKQEEELLDPMIRTTTDAIRAVAEENGFTYIFDTSTGTVLYFDRGEDILPLVKTKLGI